MSIALTTTIRNERDLLRTNLEYHRWLGVDRFYLYFDQSTDGSAETVADLPGVSMFDTVPPGEFQGGDSFDKDIRAADTQLVSRQVLNTWTATQLARSEGVQWLLHIDPDELITLGRRRVYRGALRDFLVGQPPTIEQVFFQFLEVVPSRRAVSNPFAELTLFKRLSVGRQPILDPSNGDVVSVRGILGHIQGKPAVRLSVDARLHTPHIFRHVEGRWLSTLKARYLLHYNAFSLDDFIKKYRNFSDHPDAFTWGRSVGHAKRFFRDLVNDPGATRASIDEYYQRWVVPNDETLARQRTFLGLPWGAPIVEVTSVRDAYASGAL